MLLVIVLGQDLYVKSINDITESSVTEIIEKILHKEICHNIEESELILDKEYYIYEANFIDDPGDYEDEEIGVFYVTNDTLHFHNYGTYSSF